MKKLTAFSFVLLPTFAWACWQMELPRTTVYGNTISAWVVKNGKTLKHSKVVLYSEGAPPRTSKTNLDGVFTFENTTYGKHRVVIPAWGSAEIKVVPPVLGKHPRLRFSSKDDGCLFIDDLSSRPPSPV